MSVLFPSSAKQSAQSEPILAYDGSERMEAIGWNHRSQHRMFAACESLRWTCQKFPSVENAQIGELLWGSQHGLSLMLTRGLPQCYCGFKTQWNRSGLVLQKCRTVWTDCSTWWRWELHDLES